MLLPYIHSRTGHAVKTASVEVARGNPREVLIALHQGAVTFVLLAPFNCAEIVRSAGDAAVGAFVGALTALHAPHRAKTEYRLQMD
jgi:hypothetical protein